MDTPSYPPIIVTGPQRSGTTIASQIIADDLGRQAVDETEFAFGSDYSNCVLQLPQALDHYILLQHMYEGAQFLFVRRNPDDIIASLKRIHWCKDDVRNWELFLHRYVSSRISLWNHIKNVIPHACSEIDYEALSSHRFFVPSDQRIEFTSKQWQLEHPIGPRYWSNNSECIKATYGSRHIKGSTG